MLANAFLVTEIVIVNGITTELFKHFIIEFQFCNIFYGEYFIPSRFSLIYFATL